MSDRVPVVVISREHLQEAGESYFQHLRFAALVSILLLAAAIACLIHAMVPAFCRRSTSCMVALLTRLFRERERLSDIIREGSGPLVLTMLVLLCIPPLMLMIAAGGQVLLLPLAATCLAVPLAYLFSNPDLDPVD